MSDKDITLRIVVAALITMFGCMLLVMSFITPPLGEIHPSVLAAIGEVLTFAGALFGIDTSYKKKLIDSKNKG